MGGCPPSTDLSSTFSWEDCKLCSFLWIPICERTSAFQPPVQGKFDFVEKIAALDEFSTEIVLDRMKEKKKNVGGIGGGEPATGKLLGDEGRGSVQTAQAVSPMYTLPDRCHSGGARVTSRVKLGLRAGVRCKLCGPKLRVQSLVTDVPPW